MILLFLSFNDFLIIGNQMPQSLEIFFVPYTKSLKNDFYKLFIFVFILSIHLEKKNTYESLTVTNVHRKCTHALFWNIKIKPTVNYIICLSLNFLPSCLHSDFFFSSVSDNFFCRDLIFTTEWVDLCIFINVLYIFLATSTMLIIQGRSFNNRNTVVWPSTLSEVSKSLVTFAEIWGFFFLLPSNIGEVFFLASRFNSSNRT